MVAVGIWVEGNRRITYSGGVVGMQKAGRERKREGIGMNSSGEVCRRSAGRMTRRGFLGVTGEGKVVAYDPRRHHDTISRRRRSPFARADLSAYLYFFIKNF